MPFGTKLTGPRVACVANIFVSYTSSDRNWAFWVAKELEALGHTPHIHEWEIRGGDIWLKVHHDQWLGR